MSFLYFLENLRTPFLDSIMLLVTRLGEESVFLLLALLMLWCADKKHGYALLITGFMGILINQTLKLAFRIPRPKILDPQFTVVEGATEAATGYSFPSGHTQSVTCVFGSLGVYFKRTWPRVLCALVILIVALSRMYLGVHTPLDVGVSLLIGALLVLVIHPLLLRALQQPRTAWWVFGSLVLLATLFVLYVECFPFPADIDLSNWQSGRKNAYTMLGCACAVLPVYALDTRRIHFQTKAPLPAQLLKLVLGAALTVALKAILKQPLLALCGGHAVSHAIRYALIVLFAGCVWPLTFPLWTRLFGGRTAN